MATFTLPGGPRVDTARRRRPRVESTTVQKRPPGGINRFRVTFPDAPTQDVDVLSIEDRNRITELGGTVSVLGTPVIEEPRLPFPTDITIEQAVEQFRFEDVADIRSIFPEEFGRLGRFDRPQDALPFVESGAFQEPDLPEQTFQTDLETVFPEQDFQDLISSLVIDEVMPQPERIRAERAREDFLDTLQARGRTPETENILRTLIPDITDREIRDFLGLSFKERLLSTPDDVAETLILNGVEESEVSKILELSKLDLTSEEWLVKWRSLDPNPSVARDILYSTVTRSISGAVGDMMNAIGGAEARLGSDTMADNLMGIGGTLTSFAPPMVWEGTESLTDPRFWVTTFPRMTTFTLTAGAMTILAYAASAVGVGALGIGAGATAIMTHLIGSGSSAAIEAALEAGGARNEAIAKGMSEVEADKVFNSVYGKNFILIFGSNLVTFGLAGVGGFGRIVPQRIVAATERGLLRPIVTTGKAFVGALSEGGQEAAQEHITAVALGERLEWNDPEVQLAFIFGAAMGGVVVGGGNIIQRITDKTVARVTPEQRGAFVIEKARLVDAGLTDGAASLGGLDSITDETVEPIIQEESEAILREQAGEELKTGDPQEDLAVEHITGQVEEVTPEVTPEVVRPVEVTQESDIITRLMRTFQLADENARLGREFLETNVRPAFLERFDDAPVMDIRVRQGETFLEISTGGWRERAESIGLEFDRELGFSSLYRIPGFSLEPGVPRIAPTEPTIEDLEFTEIQGQATEKAITVERIDEPPFRFKVTTDNQVIKTRDLEQAREIVETGVVESAPETVEIAPITTEAVEGTQRQVGSFEVMTDKDGRTIFCG